MELFCRRKSLVLVTAVGILKGAARCSSISQDCLLGFAGGEVLLVMEIHVGVTRIRLKNLRRFSGTYNYTLGEIE